MRIRLQLQAAIVLSVLVSLGTVWIVAATDRAEDGASRTQAQAQLMAHEVTGLLVLTQEYARHAEPRAAGQWQARMQAIQAALADEHASFADGPAFQELKAVADALPPLFDTLQLASAQSDAFSERRKEMVLDRLLTNTQAMSDYAYQWHQDAVQERLEASSRFRLAALGGPLLMLLVVIGSALVVRMRVLKPMQALERATQAVASGDLATRLNNPAKDELGDLARHFDRMTASLAGSGEQLRQSEAQLRAVTDNVPVLITYVDRDQVYRFANAHHRVVFGVEPERLLGRSLQQFWADDKAAYAQMRPPAEAALRGESVVFESLRGTPRGPRHFQSVYLPDLDERGQVRGFYAMTTDVTERKQVAAAQAISEERVRNILRHAPDAFVSLDIHGRITRWNRQAEATFGWREAEVLGRTMHELLIPERHRAAHLAGFERFRETGEGPVVNQRIEITALHRDGHEIPVELSVGAVREPEGHVANAFLRDISDRLAAKQQLQALARVDVLTGLPNRLQFNERLPEALARRQRSRAALALLFLDVDHFKSINDSRGHAAGDAVLVQFASTVSACVRKTDSVARLAGDEFVVLLEGLHNDAEPQAVARKIVQAVNRPMQFEGALLQVSTSIGIAYLAPEALPVEAAALLARADEALYAAKRGGRNGFRMLALAASSAEDAS